MCIFERVDTDIETGKITGTYQYSKTFDSPDEVSWWLLSKRSTYDNESYDILQEIYLLTTVTKDWKIKQGYGKKKTIFNNLNCGLREYYKEVSIFNPNTIKLCFSHCLSMFDYINDDKKNVVTYASIWDQASKIAEENKIGDGLEHSWVNELSLKYNINIFVDGETDQHFTIEDNPNGAIFLDSDYSHALFVLPKKHKKHESLINAYKSFSEDAQRVMDKINADKALYTKRQKYIAYDFEFFSKQKENGTEIEKYPYMFSIASAEYKMEKLKQESKVITREKGDEKFLEKCLDLILEQCTGKWNIVMAHNGFKADYPFLANVLLKKPSNELSRSKKDNYTLGSQMNTIAEMFDYTPVIKSAEEVEILKKEKE